MATDTLNVPQEEGTHNIGEYEVTVERNLVEKAREESGLAGVNSFEDGDYENEVRVTYRGHFGEDELTDLRESEWKLVYIGNEGTSTVIRIRYEGDEEDEEDEEGEEVGELFG